MGEPIKKDHYQPWKLTLVQMRRKAAGKPVRVRNYIGDWQRTWHSRVDTERLQQASQLRWLCRHQPPPRRLRRSRRRKSEPPSSQPA